jgi:hypothetical protein
MYVIVGKQKQNRIQCDDLKRLLDEKGIQYDCIDMMEMPNKTMTYLRMYCNSFPIVLKTNYVYIIIFIILLLALIIF